MACPKCKPQRVIMPGGKAASLYARLREKLVVVDSFGCYTPSRGKKRPGDCTAYPRHHWDGPGRFPIAIAFGKNGRRPTFDEFCKAYNIETMED